MSPRLKDLLENSMKEIQAGKSVTELLTKSVENTKQVIQESRELLRQSIEALAKLHPTREQ